MAQCNCLWPFTRTYPTPLAESDYLPEAAAEILKARGNLDEETLAYLDAVQPAVDSPGKCRSTGNGPG